MYKLEIKLKQHTPLIHFQHDQEDATLRASEVKPKLDKYILAQLGKGDYENGKSKAKSEGWLVGKGEHPALDYKMRIEKPRTKSDNNEANNNEWKTPIKDERLYFGNMNSENPKDFSYTQNLIDLTILSTNSKIVEALKQHIVYFFLTNNFGTRQSKGFGSFSVRSIDENENVCEIPNNYISFYETSSSKVFGDIEWIHKTLRSGINGKSPFSLYFKSLLYSFAKSEIWDKKSIKSHFLSEKTKKSVEERRANNFNMYNMGRRTAVLPSGSNPDNPKDYAHWQTPDNIQFGRYDMRDYLGLSTNETWMAYDTGVFELRGGVPRTKTNKRTGMEEYVLEKMRVCKSLDSDFNNTGRFKSPILYKPIEQKNGTWKVYVFGDDSSLSALNGKTINYRCNMPETQDFSLKLQPNFSVCKFLKWAFTLDEGQLKSHFSVNRFPFNPQKHRNANDIENYKRIIRLYSELRRNINKVAVL